MPEHAVPVGSMLDTATPTTWMEELMTPYETITLYHAPQSRSSATLTLLEELGAPYELHLLNIKRGEQRRSAYLAVNPLGKVPAIRHRGALVTEQVAIFLYLGDLFPKAGLAPAPGDSLRGPYLRWMVYYAACYEPAVVDRAMKREPGPLAMSPYGDFDTMLGTIVERFANAPYLLGDRFSGADILWGMALQWGTMFKIIPEDPAVTSYLARVTSRASFAKVAALDTEWAAEHEYAIKEAN
jgi:glutathione S-transferase